MHKTILQILNCYSTLNPIFHFYLDCNKLITRISYLCLLVLQSKINLKNFTVRKPSTKLKVYWIPRFTIGGWTVSSVCTLIYEMGFEESKGDLWSWACSVCISCNWEAMIQDEVDFCWICCQQLGNQFLRALSLTNKSISDFLLLESNLISSSLFTTTTYFL